MENTENTGLTIEQVLAQLEAEKKEKAAALAMLEQMNKRLEEADDQKESLYPTVTVNKQSYAIVVAIMVYKGRKITADDVKKDKALAAALVKSGSGMLELIEKEK